MKKTTREFGECKKCNGQGCQKGALVVCNWCSGRGRTLIKETIEESDEKIKDWRDDSFCPLFKKSMESDDMKEFIEKKCGWELVEGEAAPVPKISKYFCGFVQTCPCGKVYNSVEF
jgi:RecJ-like exonuclease